MSKIVYICEIDNKSIYYNEEKDEFYAVDYDFFDAPLESDFEVTPDFYTPEQMERLAQVRINEEEKIESYKNLYKMTKELKNSHQYKIDQIRKKVRKRAKNKEKRQKINKYFTTSYVFALITILAYIKTIPLRENMQNNYKSFIDNYRKEHQNDDEHLKLFNNAIENNSTIDSDLKEVLKADFDLLVERDIYIDMWTMKAICSRLKNNDFTNYNAYNYTETLAFILFGNKDIVSISLAGQLDECACDREPSKLSLLFGSLFIPNKTDLLTNVFADGTGHYAKNVAEYYGVNEKDIKKLYNLLEQYYKAESEEEKADLESSYYNALAIILSDYYRDKNNVKEIDKYILASHVYNGEFKYKNNVFNDIFIITYNDPKYGPYELYFDSTTGVDISPSIYYDKLVNLIKLKGNNWDYTDSDCRFLIYMTVLAYEDKLYTKTDELTFCQTPADLATKIFEYNFSKNDGFINIQPQILYAYLSNGKIYLDDILKCMRTPNDDALSLALFIEYDRCLKMDIALENISKEEYEKNLERILEWISKDGEEIYNIVTNALNTNTSLLSKFKLYPFNYDYANEDIKKFIYEPSE